MQRTRSPNQGLWSPPGGKLHQAVGESPHACAAREAEEELGINAHPPNLTSEESSVKKDTKGEHHWMMFLFEYTKRLHTLPPEHPEGHFRFFPMKYFENLNIPKRIKRLFGHYLRSIGMAFSQWNAIAEDGSFTWKELESNHSSTKRTHDRFTQ
jgi:ADP-ribose pyrophosphatase YjhB (NUDIX family)